METYVLRWTKDNLPFWQGGDDGEKIEINAVADVINENVALKGKWEKEEYRCPQCGLGNPRIATLAKMVDKAMGRIEGEHEPCPFCDEMYWAGRIGHREDCPFVLLTKENER